MFISNFKHSDCFTNHLKSPLLSGLWPLDWLSDIPCRPLRLSVLDPVRQTPPSLQPTVIKSNGSVWLSKVLNYSPPAWPCQAFSLKQNCISKDTSKTLKIFAEKLLELYQTTSYCNWLFWYSDYFYLTLFKNYLLVLLYRQMIHFLLYECMFLC